MIQVEWKGKMGFWAEMPDGTGFLMDAGPSSGGEGKGVSPVEAFLASLAGCMAMDVVSILAKMRQTVTSYRIEVIHVRAPSGVFPRPVTSITLRHVLEGESLDRAAIQKAVDLSDEKYCSVAATLRLSPPMRSEIEVRGKEG